MAKRIESAHAHAALAGRDGCGERLLAREVDDVGGGAGELGKRHQVVHALGLDDRRAALVVLAGIGLAGGEEFLAALEDEGLVFAVGGDDHAEFPGELEGAVELGVVDAEGALVGEENFERRDAPRDDLAELRLGGGVELRDAHVKREVARRFPCGLGVPELKRSEGVVFARGATHLDERGGAADERGLRAGNIGILRHRTHEREIDVHVRINEARKDVFPRGVDHLGAGQWCNIAVDTSDRFTLAVDVGKVARISGDDFAVFYKK